MKHQDTLGNPEWVAGHIKELRELFSLSGEVLNGGLVMKLGAKLYQLGVDFEENNRPGFNRTITMLKDAGCCEFVHHPFLGTIIRRKPVEQFEIIAAQSKVDWVLNQEPDEDSRQIFGELFSKIKNSKPD